MDREPMEELFVVGAWERVVSLGVWHAGLEGLFATAEPGIVLLLGKAGTGLPCIISGGDLVEHRDSVTSALRGNSIVFMLGV